MGYYTEFEFGIHCDINGELLGDGRKCEIIEYIDSNKESYLAAFAPAALAHPEDSCWAAEESMKWYTMKKDMKELSLLFSDVVFVVKGEGEDENDKWHEYFLNGMSQRCRANIKIAYPEFDPDKLRKVETER